MIQAYIKRCKSVRKTTQKTQKPWLEAIKALIYLSCLLLSLLLLLSLRLIQFLAIVTDLEVALAAK